MGIDWTHQLAEQLDRHWRRQLRPRYDGLTDAEYFWEPVASTWNIRPRGHGRAAIAAGGGDFIIDYAYPEPTPAPVTTIAWRLAHLIVSVFGTRVADHFGGPPVDDLAFNYAGTAAQALRQLDDVYAAWLAGVKSLGEAGLARPCGPAEGPLAEYPMATLVLHINREALHHGAEIALLRDLYANRLPISRRPASRLGGSIYSCPTSGDRTATGKSPEQRHVSVLEISLRCTVVAVQPVFHVAVLVSWQRVSPVQVHCADVPQPGLFQHPPRRGIDSHRGGDNLADAQFAEGAPDQGLRPLGRIPPAPRADTQPVTHARHRDITRWRVGPVHHRRGGGRHRPQPEPSDEPAVAGVSGPEPKATVTVVVGQEPGQDLGLDLRPRLGRGIEETHNPWITVQRQQVISVRRGELPQHQPRGDLHGLHDTDRCAGPAGSQPNSLPPSDGKIALAAA